MTRHVSGPGQPRWPRWRAEHRRLPEARFDLYSHNGYALQVAVRRARWFLGFLGGFIMRQKLLILAALAAGCTTQFTLAQEQKQPAGKGEARKIIGTVERLDPRFDQLIPRDA